eukprot:NODE_266_length_11332_cov_0.554705.p8 type:complete len:144 gc:universal NODE_266_length_11332_cov_0.554705:6399-5968(-)
MKKAKKKIKKMIKEGMLKEVSGASHTVPGFFAVKPNGELRLLMNAKYLNRFLARRSVHIPTINELLYRITRCLIFTAIDLTGGYNQVRIDESFAKFVNITLPFGTYRYLRMPQGLCTSVEAFQEIMQSLIGHGSYYMGQKTKI